MEEKKFTGSVRGITAEQVVREQEFSMYSRHFHESYELYFLLEGERYYFIEQETYLVRKGMAVFLNRDQIHKTSMAGGQVYHDRFLLQLDAAVMDPCLKACGQPPLTDLGSQYWGVVGFSAGDWARITGLIAGLKKELKEREESSESLVRLHTLELLILYCRNKRRMDMEDWKGGEGRRESYRVQTGMYQKIHEVAQYLQTHSSSKESLEELSARFYISKSYLTRIFKAVTGFTINEYQNLARIKKARILLAETDDSITWISEQTGFENVTYFDRVFKKHTAMSPLQYRKQRRGQTESPDGLTALPFDQ